MQPEYTEKHILLILPRDLNVKVEKPGTTGSNVSLVDARADLESRLDQIAGERSELCLQHAAMERHEIERRLSESKVTGHVV